MQQGGIEPQEVSGLRPAPEVPPLAPRLRLLAQVGEQSLVGLMQGQEPVPLLTQVVDLLACICEPGLGDLGAHAQTGWFVRCVLSRMVSRRDGPVRPARDTRDRRIDPVQLGWIDGPTACSLVPGGRNLAGLNGPQDGALALAARPGGLSESVCHEGCAPFQRDSPRDSMQYPRLITRKAFAINQFAAGGDATPDESGSLERLLSPALCKRLQVDVPRWNEMPL